MKIFFLILVSTNVFAEMDRSLRSIPVGVASPSSWDAVTSNPGAISPSKQWLGSAQVLPKVWGQYEHYLRVGASKGAGPVGGALAIGRSLCSSPTTEVFGGVGLWANDNLSLGVGGHFPVNSTFGSEKRLTTSLRYSNGWTAFTLLWDSLESGSARSRIITGVTLLGTFADIAIDVRTPLLEDLRGLDEKYEVALSAAFTIGKTASFYGRVAYPVILEWDSQLPMWRGGLQLTMTPQTNCGAFVEKYGIVGANCQMIF